VRKKSRKQSHLQQLQKKFQGINLMKEMKDFFNENYKSLKKEIKDIRR
jgi:hypothetical protein